MHVVLLAVERDLQCSFLATSEVPGDGLEFVVVAGVGLHVNAHTMLSGHQGHGARFVPLSSSKQHEMLLGLALQRMGVEESVLTPDGDIAVGEMMFDVDEKRSVSSGVGSSEASSRSADPNMS